MAREVTLLVNPTAGKGRALQLAGPVADRLRRAGLVVHQLSGADADEAASLARDAVKEGTDALVAFGGDGMANLAIQAVVGTDTPMGIIPTGTGNDLARAVRIPLEPFAAADVVAAG